MVDSQGADPQKPATLLLLKSPAHAFLAWLVAGPLTAAYWLWILDLFSVTPGVQQPEPTLLVFAGRWLMTGLPSMIGVSIGFLLYSRLKLKDQTNVCFAAIGAALITLALALIVASIVVAGIEANDGRDPVAAVIFTIGAGAIIGGLVAAPMALISFGSIRIIAFRAEVLPRT